MTGGWAEVLNEAANQIVLIWLVVTAPFIGSFLALLAFRLPEGRPVAAARSECETCGRRLGVLDLIPLFSYLALSGRCRTCKAPIPQALPLIELAALFLCLWTLWTLGPFASLGLILASLFLGYSLIALTVTDIRHFLLPDVLTLPLIPLGLGVTAAFDIDRLPLHTAAAFAGYGLLWLIGFAYRRFRGRDGIGLGDAKLLAAAGAWVGPLGLPSVMLLGAAGGLAFAALLALSGRKIGPTTAMPFGPFLALGLWITWLYGPVQF